MIFIDRKMLIYFPIKSLQLISKEDWEGVKLNLGERRKKKRRNIILHGRFCPKYQVFQNFGKLVVFQH